MKWDTAAEMGTSGRPHPGFRTFASRVYASQFSYIYIS
jgi:hypothetical protein